MIEPRATDLRTAAILHNRFDSLTAMFDYRTMCKLGIFLAETLLLARKHITVFVLL